MAKTQGSITKTKKGEDKEFKGAGVEGTKASEADKKSAQEQEDKKAAQEQAEKKAAEEAELTAQGESDLLKGLKVNLKEREVENDKLLEEEDERGFMDGHLMTLRKGRVAAIEKIEAEIKSLTK